MDSKDVITHVKNLEKNKANEDTVLDILKILDTELRPTEKLLRETKVGVVVNQFKKSGNDEISKLVKKMISSWKDAISKEKKQRIAASKSSTSENSSAPKKQDKYVSSKPRNAKNDGVNTIIYGNKLAS